MGKNIKVNVNVVDAQSKAFSKMAKNFEAKNMGYKDTRTTVPANRKCQGVFAKNENSINMLGKAFLQYAGNIKTMGSEFHSLDKEMATKSKK